VRICAVAGDRCSVVWVAAPKEAERLIALTDEELSRPPKGNHIPFSAASTSNRDATCFRWRSSSRGSLHCIVSCWSRGCACAAADRRAGLNMGLRDAADIADIVREAMLSGEDPGSPQVVEALRFSRRADIASRTSPSMPQTAHCSAISCPCRPCVRPACI